MAARERELAQWVAQADSVVAVSVFGDPARRRKDALSRHAKANTALLAFNGEASLSLMTRDAGATQHNFPAETLRQLAAEQPPTAAHEHAAARIWLAARGLWQVGGAGNTATLFAQRLNPRLALPAPMPEPTLRLRVGQRELRRLERLGSGARKDHGRLWQAAGPRPDLR